MHALGQLGHLILAPLYYAVSAVLLAWHWFFSLFMNPNSGGAWVLSIIGLTLVVRAALIPLFVKQIKSSRNMQLIQPRVKELQKKYGHDRERLAQETMALYKETGTNPFSACLPLLVQTPVFIALFRLLDQAYKHGTANGFMTPGQAYSLGHAKLFGTIPISATFLKPFAANSDVKILGVQVLAAILVVAMTVTTFTTQRQLMSKNMPADAMSGQYAQQQKLLLYVLPVVFAVGGIAFPIGVLFYWTTTNLWTMGQQFYVIRRNPAPGTPAFDAKVARDRARGRTTELSQELAVEEAHGDKRPEQEKPRQRQQPQKQSREKRKKGKKPGQPGSGRPQAGGAGQAGGGAADDPGTNAADDDDTDQGKSA